MSDLQRPHGLQPSRLLHPWDFPGKSTGVGCHCLLLTLYYAHTNHWTKLRRAETKSKKKFNLLQGKNLTFLEAWEKETSNIITFLKKIMERQKNTAQMKEQTRNTEVQINEEEMGKLPEKEFRIMIIKMIKNFENKIEKMQ